MTGKQSRRKTKKTKQKAKETAALLWPLTVYSGIRSPSLLIEFPGICHTHSPSTNKTLVSQHPHELKAPEPV